METQTATNWIWIDLEMTGLDPTVNCIIEIATVVTNSELQTIAEGPVIAIHRSDATLAGMDSWNTHHHTASGLVERVKNSRYTAEMAEQETVDFLQRYVLPGKSPMCGNSICQDRRFLYNEMPALAAFFHYRNLDVSSLKILAERWAPEVFKGLSKESTHVALADIYDSIAELRYYRQHLFML